MKSYLLSGNRDTYIGMKLAGVDGVYLQEGDDIEQAFKEALSGGYGIILMTEKIYHSIKEEVIHTKTTTKIPLITVIPDRHGYNNDKERIMSYIKESIGL
ncbi:ATPase [Alkalibaculum sp. M08DMB]|uniref:ATPase n=1 Tax=Alkalibaculum sporogenes TaxID=2655001 RepID=A0A6A7K5R9_9FIRM|nr:V-type ATP synthase subunit F [Alkalibaculum sporogenes]MPW24617.1 ATPase [Alkalibaculum sporogenes]